MAKFKQSAEKDLEAKRKYSKKKQSALADIGEIPPCKNPGRRAACARRLDLALQWYFPESTGLGQFSVDHYDVIDNIQSVFFGGGWYVNAVFREFAKTSIAENATMWGALNGHIKYWPIIGADEDAAKQILESIEIELTTNDRLYDDFPEVCHAFRHLEGKHARCPTQTCEAWQSCPDCNGSGFSFGDGRMSGDCEECGGAGERYSPMLTRINCVGGEIVFPIIKLLPDKARKLNIPVRDDGTILGAGAAIVAKGILSIKRGMKRKLPNGKSQRPDGCLIDDFQTDESAKSEEMTRTRVSKIRKAIIPSSGQRKRMGIIANGTVIEPNCGMSQLLDRKQFPSFQMRRIPILKSRACKDGEKIWFGAYRDLLLSWNRDSVNSEHEQKRARQDATNLYLQNREVMDRDAAATWHTAHEEWEASAIQHCYNIWIEQGEDVFLCEGQQQPKIEEAQQRRMTAAAICSKANGLERGVVPSWGSRLVAHIDVQDSVLYWLVLAAGESFTSHVVDYGTWPRQPTGTFDLYRIKTGGQTLQKVSPGVGHEGAIRAGIDSLVSHLWGASWRREGGHLCSLDFGLIDAADNSSIVYEAVKRSQYKATLRAARGWKFGAADLSWEEFQSKYKRQGEEFYWHLWETPIEAGTRLVKMDSNHWKTFAMNRMATAPGDIGCLSLFGRPNDHEDFVRHILAPDSQVMRSEKGRSVEEWKTRSGVDDHLFDTLYGAFAAAARAGVTIPSLGGRGNGVKRKRYSQEDVNRASREIRQ